MEKRKLAMLYILNESSQRLNALKWCCFGCPPPLPPVYFFPLLVLLRYLLPCVLDISLHSILQEEEAAISGSSLLISSSTYVQLYSTNNTLTSEVVQKWRTNKIFIYLEKKMLTPKCIYENRRSLNFRAIFSYFIMYSYFVML